MTQPGDCDFVRDGVPLRIILDKVAFIRRHNKWSLGKGMFGRPNVKLTAHHSGVFSGRPKAIAR